MLHPREIARLAIAAKREKENRQVEETLSAIESATEKAEKKQDFASVKVSVSTSALLQADINRVLVREAISPTAQMFIKIENSRNKSEREQGFVARFFEVILGIKLNG